jgi:hypothetical protein
MMSDEKVDIRIGYKDMAMLSSIENQDDIDHNLKKDFIKIIDMLDLSKDMVLDDYEKQKSDRFIEWKQFGGNNIGLSIFGERYYFQSIVEYVEKIRESEDYKDFMDGKSNEEEKTNKDNRYSNK